MSKSLEKELHSLREKLSEKDREIECKNTTIQDKDIQLQEVIAAYEARIEKLLAAQRIAFGKKSERFVDISDDQVSLFETDSEETAIEASDMEDITYRRPKSTGKKKQNLDDLPHQEQVIPVPEADRVCGCGDMKGFVKYECKHMLHYVPDVLAVLVHKREVLACKKGCQQSIVTAPVLPHILPKSKVTESLLAYISVSKVLDRQPLYHIEKKLEREHGWRISRQIMSRWLILLADKLQPLINLMKDEVLNYDISAVDATVLQVLNEPNRSAETKSQAYCIRGGPPGKEVTVYEYNGYRQQEYVTGFYEGYKGTISSDASPVFNGIRKQNGVHLRYCHAHARRKFETIDTARRRGKKKTKKGLAFHVLKHVYQPLYDIEAVIKKKTFTSDEATAYRHEHARPILEAHKCWLDKHYDLTPGQSPIRKAIAYSLNHWEGLMVYLDDARVPIDNNATERDIKPFVIARKNFLFSATQAGADALGVHFSLIVTAKHHGLDPMAYYTEVLKRIPLCRSIEDYEALLPWNFKS